MMPIMGEFFNQAKPKDGSLLSSPGTLRANSPDWRIIVIFWVDRMTLRVVIRFARSQ
jgi:hypothetical protein